MPHISNLSGVYTEDQAHTHDVAYLRNRLAVSVSDSLTIETASTGYNLHKTVLESFTLSDSVEGRKLLDFVRSVSESVMIAVTVVRRSCRVLPFLHS